MKLCRLKISVPFPYPPSFPNWSSYRFLRKQLFSCWRGTKSLRSSSSPRALPPLASLHHERMALQPPHGETQQSPALQDRGKDRHCLGLQGGWNRTPRAGKHPSRTPKATQRKDLHVLPNLKHQTWAWKSAELSQVPPTHSNDMYRAVLPK